MVSHKHVSYIVSVEYNECTQVTTGIRRDGHDAGEGGNSLTNREVLEHLDPRVDSLTYIYDTFKWSHCEDDGFNMNDALLPLR